MVEENKNLEFKGKIIIKLKIAAETGLHIGSSREVAKIGGVDNPVIRDPLTEEPYIPGSSLKGKISSLLEKSLGFVKQGQEIHRCAEPNCPICRLFGSSEQEKKKKQSVGEGRLIFRDFYLTDKWRKEFNERIKEGKEFFEEKTENVISRLTGTTISGGLRTMERVPKGTEFEGEIIYNFVKKPNQEIKLEEDFKNLFAGLKLLQDDYLGGSGSRGYGKVKIKVVEVKVRRKNYYVGEEKEKKVIEEKEEEKEEKDKKDLGIEKINIEEYIEKIKSFLDKIKPE